MEERFLVRNMHSSTERMVTIEEFESQALGLQGYVLVRPPEPTPSIVPHAEITSVEEALALARAVTGDNPVPIHVQAVIDSALEEDPTDL